MKTNRSQKVKEIWQSISTGSVNSRIFSAAIIVAGGTLFVKVLAVVKELIVASKFGTSDELDAFLIALMVPVIIVTIIAGSFNAALIPTYIKVREQEGQQAAQKLFSSATIWSIGLLVIMTIFVVGAAPFYLPQITGGFSPQKLELTYQLLWVISPIILLSGITVVWGAVLNAGERFALVALAPILTPAVTICFLSGTATWGIFNLAIGLIIGQLLEMVIVGVALQRQGISVQLKWYGFDNHLKDVASQYAPMMAGALLMCSTSLVDQSMAAMLSSGSVAALAYGNRIIALPITIATTALGTAVIPYFSKMVALDDWTGIRQALKHYIGLIFATTIPLTGLIILFSEPIVRTLFQRGSFTAENTQLVAVIQACFALQIPFYIASILVVRITSAMRNNSVMMWGSAGNLIVNISLNYLFVQWFGVAGIALSTSCVYLFSFAFLLFFVLKNLRNIDKIGLTLSQQGQIEELHESKFEEIKTILSPEQQQAFKQLEMQRPSVHQRRSGIDLSADQKVELKKIRQRNLLGFRSILTSAQVEQIKQTPSFNKTISTLFSYQKLRHQQTVIAAKLGQLALTTAQTEQIEALLIIDRQQVDAVLTPEQHQQTKAMQSRRRAVKKGWKNLNLTPEQMAKMRAIRRSKKQQLNTILTPEQQAKVKQGKGKYKIQ
jgi:putative peptidoglycan lipid II flippase